MRELLYLTVLILCGCSTTNITVPIPAGTGTLTITVNQDRKGLDSLFDGVQANLPVQGGTVNNPSNTQNKTQEK